MFLSSCWNLLTLDDEWGGNARQIVSYRDISGRKLRSAGNTTGLGKSAVNGTALRASFSWGVDRSRGETCAFAQVRAFD
jgi:hypothetical protein